MPDTVGVILRDDLKDFQITGVLDNNPVLLGPRATRAAIYPLIASENVRIFAVPVRKAQKVAELREFFVRHDMPFMEESVEEWWNVPVSVNRVVECQRVICLGETYSSVFFTKDPYRWSKKV